MRRANPSGRRLSLANADIVKGMIARGDRQHDIAAYFGVNPGRVSEVKTGRKFRTARPAPLNKLPRPGPY